MPGSSQKTQNLKEIPVDSKNASTAQLPRFTFGEEHGAQAQTILTQKGALKISYEGYYYVKERNCPKIPGKEYWRCEWWGRGYKNISRPYEQCKGRLVKDLDGSLRPNSNHYHQPNYGREEALLWEAEQARKVKTKESGSKIQFDYTTLSDEGFFNAPKPALLRKRLAARCQVQRSMSGVKDQTLKKPEEVKLTPQILLFDTGPDGKERIFCLSSTKFVQYLSKCDIIHGVGAFLCHNKVYTQVFTLYGQMSATLLVPLVVFIIPNKSVSTYTRALSLLKNKVQVQQWQVKTFLIDLELALAKAVYKVFPETEILFGYCYLDQSIQKFITENDLTDLLKGDTEKSRRLRIRVNMLKALAFVPPELVSDAFDELTLAFNWAELSHLRDYFESKFIGRWRNPAVSEGMTKKFWRSKPLFEIKSWNQFSRTVKGVDCTSQIVDVFKIGFSKTFEKADPPIQRLLDHFQTDANLTAAKIFQDRTRPNIPKRTSTYENQRQSLTELTLKFEHKYKPNGKVILFLGRVGSILADL